MVTAQLSEAVGEVHVAMAVQLLPPSFDVCIVWSAGQLLITGSILSSIVTVAAPVAMFPLPSFTVKVTVLAPKLSQSKVSGDTLTKFIAPQESEDPLSISLTVMEAFPEVSNCKVISLVTTVGSPVSLTVTVWSAVAVLPALSVTVQVTMVEPSVKIAGALLVTLATSQLSSVEGDPRETEVA